MLDRRRTVNAKEPPTEAGWVKKAFRKEGRPEGSFKVRKDLDWRRERRVGGVANQHGLPGIEGLLSM